MSNGIRSACTTCLAVFLGIAQTSATLTAQRGSSTLQASVLRLASQEQFDAADRVIEGSLFSAQPDYDAFEAYLGYLVNQARPFQNVRAAHLGQKWLPVVRKAPPEVRGRIMKETAVGMLFGNFRQSQSAADRIAARRMLEDAVEANPRLCEAYLHLSLIAALEGRQLAASSLLDRTIETSDDDEQRAKFSSIRGQSKKDPAYLAMVARSVYGIGGK